MVMVKERMNFSHREKDRTHSGEDEAAAAAKKEERRGEKKKKATEVLCWLRASVSEWELH